MWPNVAMATTPPNGVELSTGCDERQIALTRGKKENYPPLGAREASSSQSDGHNGHMATLATPTQIARQWRRP